MEEEEGVYVAGEASVINNAAAAESLLTRGCALPTTHRGGGHVDSVCS
jgi:hypothetical protein